MGTARCYARWPSRTRPPGPRSSCWLPPCSRHLSCWAKEAAQTAAATAARALAMAPAPAQCWNSLTAGTACGRTATQSSVAGLPMVGLARGAGCASAARSYRWLHQVRRRVVGLGMPMCTAPPTPPLTAGPAYILAQVLAPTFAASLPIHSPTVPGDPLDLAASAATRFLLTANNTRPAPAGARLGRQRARSGYLALSSVEPNDTLVPRTALVVLRCAASHAKGGRDWAALCKRLVQALTAAGSREDTRLVVRCMCPSLSWPWLAVCL